MFGKMAKETIRITFLMGINILYSISKTLRLLKNSAWHLFLRQLHVCS
jgi:hypothetical protein